MTKKCFILGAVKNFSADWRTRGHRVDLVPGIVKWIHGEARIEQLADGTLLWNGLLLDISEQSVTVA